MEEKEAIKKLSKKAGIEPAKELSEKERKIQIMLSYSRKPYKSMAIGEHNGCYYFGSILDYGSKKVPVVITSEGKIFWNYREKVGKETLVDNEIRDKFQLNYRFELFEDCVDNLWSNQSIKKFIEGRAEKQSFQELFERIKKKNGSLIYHPDKRVNSYIACDIISNYFYPLFNAKGRTYLQAEFESGKSRQSLIYQKLSFNSLFAANVSAAAFERVIESTGGTLIVDNFDNIGDDLKKAILQCIEVYYKKGGKNIKAAGQGFEQNKPIAFNGYSPLVINNIIGLPEVTESRCNKIQMLRTKKKDIIDIKIDERDPFWEKTKDDLHLLALQNWKKVKEQYSSLNVKELSARDLEKGEAVLVIAKLVGEETYQEVLSYLIETNEQQGIRDLHDNWEFILFEFLHNVVKEGSKDIKVNEITASVGSKIVTNERDSKRDKLKFSHYCGKVLGNIPLFKKKTIDGWVHYEISRENLDKILSVKRFDRYLTIPHSTPLNNTNPTNPTNNTNNNDNNDKKGDNKEKGVRSSGVSEVKEYPQLKIETVKIGGKNE